MASPATCPVCRAFSSARNWASRLVSCRMPEVYERSGSPSVVVEAYPDAAKRRRGRLQHAQPRLRDVESTRHEQREERSQPPIAQRFVAGGAVTAGDDGVQAVIVRQEHRRCDVGGGGDGHTCLAVPPAGEALLGPAAGGAASL